MTQGLTPAHVINRLMKDLERGDLVSLSATLRWSGEYFQPAVEHARQAFASQVFKTGREAFEKIVASFGRRG